MEILELKSLTMRVLNGDGDRQALSRLYHACHAMAKVMVAQFHTRYYPSFEIAGYTPDDVAAMSIEGLFLARDGRICFELAAYFENSGLAPDAVPDAEFLIAMRKLIGIKVTRGVHEIAGEADPQYRKILRNIKDVLRTAGTWESCELFDQTVFCTSSKMEARLHLPAMPDDCILTALFDDARTDAGIGELITRIFSILDVQDEYRRACPVQTLVGVIKDYYALLSLAEEADAAGGQDEGTEAQIEECIEHTMRSLRDGLFARYRKRGKLSEEDSLRFEEAARRYCRDMLAKGPRPLFDYYCEQFEGATKQSYSRNGRTLFEYVIQSTKEKLIGCLRAELDL